MSIVNLNQFYLFSDNKWPFCQFLVDTGSAITILCKSIWERCKRTEQQLVPWSQSRLVGAEGIQLNMYGSASLELIMRLRSFNCLW